MIRIDTISTAFRCHLSKLIVTCLSIIVAGIYCISTATRILPLGDSITQADQDHASYRRPLWKKLKEAGYTVDFAGSLSTNFQKAGHLEVQPPYNDFDIDHEGHFGWRADQLADSLPRWIKGYMPDIVIMQAGHNDMKESGTLDEVLGRTLDDYKKIIEVLRGRNASVTTLLATAILSHPTKDRYNRAPKLAELNKHIPALADSLSSIESPITVVYLDKVFNPEIHTQSDGVHPNVEGEIVIAQALFKALCTHLDMQSTSRAMPDFQAGMQVKAGRAAETFIVDFLGRSLLFSSGSSKKRASPAPACAIRITGTTIKERISAHSLTTIK